MDAGLIFALADRAGRSARVTTGVDGARFGLEDSKADQPHGLSMRVTAAELRAAADAIDAWEADPAPVVAERPPTVVQAALPGME